MEQTQALAVRDVAHELPLAQLGGVLSSSGFFKDTKSAAQAIVKVIAGREMGLGPISAMTGIHVIEGKVTVGAGLLASCVKRSGRYNYRVKSLTETEAVIEFYEGGQSVGVSSFTLKDAQAAGIGGKQVWKQYPKNMLFARAMSNGVRWYCPDVTGGPVYTPEELGAEVNAEGEAINVQVVEPPPTPAPPADERTAEQKHLDALKKKLWAHAKAAGVSHEQLKNYSTETLGKSSSNEWSAEDCDNLLLYVEDIAAAKQKQEVA